LGIYAAPLSEYGYENVDVLREANEEELHEAMEELNVKKPHRKLISKAFQRLLSATRTCRRRQRNVVYSYR
jgi:hypothetical protein